MLFLTSLRGLPKQCPFNSLFEMHMKPMAMPVAIKVSVTFNSLFEMLNTLAIAVAKSGRLAFQFSI